MLGKLKYLLLFVNFVFFTLNYAYGESASKFEAFQQQEQWDVKLKLANTMLEQQETSIDMRVAIYAQLADLALSEDKYNQALKYFQLLEKNTSQSFLPNEHFRAIKMRGVTLFYKGFFQQAITEYNRALVIVTEKRQLIEQANLLNNIGLAYFNMNKLALTLEYYLKAKAIYEVQGSEQDKSDILLNIAGVYIRLSRYDAAIDIYLDVLKMYKKLGDKGGIARVNNNLGVAAFEDSKPNLALSYYKLALDYYLSVNDNNFISTQYNNLANVNLVLNKADLAYEQVKKALAYALKIDNHNEELNALHTLSKIQYVKGMLAEARVNLNRASKLAKEYDSQRIMRDALGTQSLIEASHGNYAYAMKLHEKFVNEQRKLRSDSIIKALAVIEKQFQATQLNQEIEQLKQERKVQELKMEQRSQLTVFIFVLLCLVIVTAVALYRRGAEKRAKQYLAEQVEQRTAELQNAAKELREANDIKSQFLANISHEIRTPLTAILGQTDDLIHGLYKPTELKKELEIIQRHSKHLKSLINDVLDLSKIEANRLELSISCFDMVQVITDVHAMFHPQASAKNLQLLLDNRIGKEFYTKLDLIRVKQVLINLCANAIKFTHAGQINLIASKTKQELILTVEDTGIGMTSSQLKLIFECFSQADNSISRRFGGTGLGLSLSQQLASMMGGYIDVQSEYKKGSKFSFHIPCQQVSKKIATSEESVVSTNKTLLDGRVLIAEDHADNRRFITRYLRSLGLDVIAVENGEQAVEKCLQEYPDLVLLDIQMPIMDGRSAFDLLKKCGFQRPIFALTANAMSHEIDDYLALGFDGYLAKPINKDLFYTVLSKHLGSMHTAQVHSQDEVDVSDLVQSFKQSFTVESAAIEEHFINKEHKLLQQDSHRILGAAQIFGFDDIAAAAKKLDTALLNNETENIKALVGNLQVLLKKYKQS